MPLRLSLLLLVASTSWLGCSNEPPGPIVGTWQNVPTEEDTSGYSRFYDFSQDGELAITIAHPLIGDTTYDATYEMQWDSVLTISGANETDQVIATISEDTLIFRSVDGATQRHIRAQR